MLIKTKDDEIHDVVAMSVEDGSFRLQWDIGKTTRMIVQYRLTNWDEWVEGVVKQNKHGTYLY